MQEEALEMAKKISGAEPKTGPDQKQEVRLAIFRPPLHNTGCLLQKGQSLPHCCFPLV